ncbi:MAG TPA: carboxypeptidase-like regulatory domain-containing protein, partial [bacterium]
MSDKGQPLSGAQIIVSAAGSETLPPTYTNTDGVFFVALEPTRERGGERTSLLQVNAVDYEPVEKVLHLVSGTQFEDIRLSPSPEKVSSNQPPIQQKAYSDWLFSGAGANFSDWYTLCSSPAPEGFRIAFSAFHLEGDRGCNAWSECQEEKRNDKQVCWRFRLQGHSESIFQNQGKAPSRGILDTTLEPVLAGNFQKDRYQVVYIQFFGEENRAFAEKLRQVLVNNGYRSSGVQRIDFDFRNSVKFFHEQDAKSAAELARVVSSVVN